MMIHSEYDFGPNRPIRLCEETRKFAFESIHGKYGDMAAETPCVFVDDIADFDQLTPLEQYDISIERICRQAPVRICEWEKISGSASLGQALMGVVPVFRNGSAFIPCISHVTLGFDRILRIGINELEREVDGFIAKYGENPERLSIKKMIADFRIWHKRYLDATEGTVHQNLSRVPLEPPTNFYEAVQSLWFLFAFTRLCGNWPGIGRIDEMLGGYLRKDLAENKITLDQAREILAHMFIKGCEWILSDTPRGSGDAQYYQNILLGGIDRNGNEVTNEVSYLVLDIIEELGISDFPVSIRVNSNTEENFLRRAAEVVRLGGGVVAFYDEDLVIESLERFGYEKEDARAFANDGCWEVQIPGRTYFYYVPFDGLKLLLNNTLHLDEEIPAEFSSFEELYAAYSTQIREQVELIHSEKIMNSIDSISENGTVKWKKNVPCSVIAMFTQSCAEKGKSYLEGGADFIVVSPHIGGAPDAGNSLYAIKKLVFDEKKIIFNDFMRILKENWEGEETLRLYVQNHYRYYGNDDDEADSFTVRILNDFADMVSEQNKTSPILYEPGVSTFGRQIEWAEERCATPFGSVKGKILSGNASPTPGTDLLGATAVIKSYCKANLVNMPCGAALDIEIHPSALAGENGAEALVQLIRGFRELGGFFMQIDTVNVETLKKAQENPKDYKTLSVRVSGWNARFITLSREWQDMIIEKNETNGI